MTTWPVKKSLLGVDISVANYDEVVASVAAAAENHTPAVASFFAVHPVVLASRDAELRRMVNSFELIGPDGQPVRWGLNLLHRAGLRHRVYGPQAMLRICREAERRGHDIYLYGGTETTLSKLCDRLTEKFPSLRIAGAEAPPFKPFSADDHVAAAKRISQTGADIVFIGLGAPKQDLCAAAMRDHFAGPIVCVGAAFDFHAEVKKMAPAWMQRRGLEWLYRLYQEPRRLAHRYATTNSLFLCLLLRDWFAHRLRRSASPPPGEPQP